MNKVVVLMGGASAEREISMRSGQAVLDALLAEGMDAVGLVLSENTRDWVNEMAKTKADVAFIALHGTYGEDGCIQGLLETMGLPYTGSGVMASAVCMHKRISKTIMRDAGVATPQDVVFVDGKPRTYPVFVKPVAEGSSVGLHYVEDEAAWLDLDIQNLDNWLVESCVVGTEIAVSVLNGQALPPVEIAPKSGMYDFASKYTAGATNYYCPARLAESTVQKCMRIAECVVALLGCEGAPRVDFIVPDAGEPVVLEVNTIPGMTATSLLPKSAAEVGMSFQKLCLNIVNAASLRGGA